MGDLGAVAASIPHYIPVLIVGGGAVGLTASLLLARHGIRSLIVERHRARLPQPKAHAVNPRSSEILRQIGFDVSGLRGKGAPVEESEWVNFVTTLSGVLLTRIPYERQDTQVRKVTPEPLFNVPQYILESALEEAVLRSELVQIHRNCSWNSWKINDQHLVESSITQRSDGQNHSIKSDFVVGADGTDSTVRKTLTNVSWAGLPGQNCEKLWFVSICCRGDLLSLVSELGRPGQLYFSCLPLVKGTLIAHDLSSNWVLIRRVDLDVEPPSSFTQARCQELVDEFIGKKLDYEIVAANSWFTEPRIASSYSSADHKIFLAGDAAHSFPPTGGLGINTGMADVHNLCWKLAYSLQGKSQNPGRLLESYSSERRPIAIANAQQSWHNSLVWFESMENLSRDLEPDLPIDEIENRLQNPAFLAAAREALEANRLHFDSLGLQIGYAYGQPDCAVRLREDCSRYEPSIKSGYRLPHSWLVDGRSSLDLISDTDITLLVRESVDSDAENKITIATNYPFSVILQSAGKGDADKLLEYLGLDVGEGLLIRPDQHIVGKVRSAQDVVGLLMNSF
ncbi:uncharacterized protein A1O9_10274 [Exophiala aquamarina CBS 119918]|uniref:FAD-binding domain-containing protein n=1 Tax=Exophiala aquamarina CBS 119918 TaxID=1182545 RepID=A0A072P2F0_9EURO|nr:uncharacterized protein A1O9_10274 [Exophiala aquamarina CBS 119918]KEF53872.1 hypothetical protein A1O9_10274 [Exophiala aquamarina CBS 119918]